MTLSVVIVTKDRYYNLKGCIEALEKCKGIDEIVIADYHSKDTDFAWVKDVKIPTKLIVCDGDFSQGEGRNIGAKNSTGEMIFFLDADCLVPQLLIDKIHFLVPKGVAYFPIMQMLNEDGSEGEWCFTAFGQAAVTREQWEDNHWQEWTSYGGEDNIFFDKYKFTCAVRDTPFGYKHQWHSMLARVENYKDGAGKGLEEFIEKRDNAKSSTN